MDATGNNTKPILILTTEPLPLSGCATSGAGLRAWGLFKGLSASGLNVVVATAAPRPETAPDTANIRFFSRNDIASLLDKVAPVAVVLQHWGLACDIPPLSVPLAIDLAGPHLLERKFWGNRDTDADITEKLNALRRADLVTVSGAWQRHYFYPFLMQAGFDLTQTTIPVIPFSVAPLADDERNSLEAAPREPHSFVYGGAFLAWQDPDKPIHWLLDEMDNAGKGTLYFYGGSHPVIDASNGRFADLIEFLKHHARVHFSPFIPFDQLNEQYKKYQVAIDLMAFNPERELAYTTRTLNYLRCGLPVLYNSYSELSAQITDTNAGLTFDPNDENKFRAAVRAILADEIDLAVMRRNALDLATRHDWNKTVAPLARWCRQPSFRDGKTETALRWEVAYNEAQRLRAENDTLRHELDTLKGKRLVRLACKASAFSVLLAPFAWLGTWVATKYIAYTLNKSGKNS